MGVPESGDTHAAHLQDFFQSTRPGSGSLPVTAQSPYLPRWLSGKEPVCQCRSLGFSLWVGKIPWRRAWQPTPVFFPGEPHAQRSLVGYSPWGHKESDTADRLTLCLFTSQISRSQMRLWQGRRWRCDSALHWSAGLCWHRCPLPHEG